MAKRIQISEHFQFATLSNYFGTTSCLYCGKPIGSGMPESHVPEYCIRIGENRFHIDCVKPMFEKIMQVINDNKEYIEEQKKIFLARKI